MKTTFDNYNKLQIRRKLNNKQLNFESDFMKLQPSDMNYL